MKEKQKEIKLSPGVLKALRETSGYSIEEIAKKLDTTTERVLSVEEGKSGFTLNQIRNLGDIYKRPLVAFFSDSIPELPKLVDYRINREKRLTPQVYLAERKAYYLSEKIKELSNKRSQIPSFSEELNADEFARQFRRYLNTELIKFQKPREILAHYKKALEDALTIIIIEYPLKADDVRAFSVSSDICVIVLNEGDKPSIKLFSLFHEVCHLLKKSAGICSLEIEQQEQEMESYCNRFAAEFLVPLDDLKNEVEKLAQIDEGAINQLSGIYGVSKQVIMLRLLLLRNITKEKYEQFKSGLEKPIKRFGRRNWEKVFLNRVGNLPLNEIKKSYNEGKITFYEASSILDLKTKYAEKFITSR
ncbi:MAG: ImmA/IrrE family metallo-endopeptidase [Methanophagales archaeon ANME-1-THS]|nr:MAG: ImmA/IrrE family metallo-endopeptidase [Methanophagales archaeon ANME-1-THS]